MPAEDEHDPLDSWLSQQVRPLPPPPGTFALITRRARRRKIRKAVITVASAAVAAAVVGIAVPVGLSLHLTPSTSAGLAAGSSPQPARASQTELGTASSKAPAAAVPSTAPAVSGAAPGYLPPGFQPSSVTWDSTRTGWIIGPAGTAGHCANANPDICTSVARTDDGGQTWQGLPAPDAGRPDGADGVSGIRFLDGVNGWAFGPELWSTHNGGKSWARVAAGGRRVTDLETAGNRAYALFAQCSGSNPASFAAACTSYTLMTVTAGSDQWTPVGTATSGLTDQGAATGAMITLTGTTGYLAAPDGTLYSGPLGGSWAKAGTLPCRPGTPQASGLPGDALVALAGQTELVTVCRGSTAAAAPAVYTSGDSGATWTTAGSWTAASAPGQPASVAGTSTGTLLLATDQGIYLLPKGASQWQASGAAGTQAPPGGFSYVGMTTSEQGVALAADASLHEIWMTADGGLTWQARAIKSS
jgi:hypothetical protein